MSAFSRLWLPKPGRFGLQLVTPVVDIGTGARLPVASSTVYVQLGKPYASCQLINLSINGLTAAAGSGAITAQVFRVVGGASGTRTALTATFDLTSGGFTTLDKPFNWAITGTDTQCITQNVDAYTIDLVCAGTLTTTPQIVVTPTLAVRS